MYERTKAAITPQRSEIETKIFFSQVTCFHLGMQDLIQPVSGAEIN